MPNYTDIYSIPWYQEDDTITQGIEERRMVTIDNQLYSFATIFGNGVISGWDVEGNLEGLRVSVSPGKGLIRWLACETDTAEIIENLPANHSMDEEPIYIYAIYTDTSAQDRSVNFFFNTDGVAPSFALLLAKVATDADSVIEVDTSVKETIEFLANIASDVINHIHIGGDDNPSPIDLVSHVTGKLSEAYMEDIDASKITGEINPERIAQIQHSNLANIGSNTHNEIDTLLSLLDESSVSKMGDVSFSNLLQLILAVKHYWTNIDEYLHNSFFFIPGITSNSFIDLTNTTAIIDEQNHKIKGITGGIRDTLQIKYDTYNDFNKNVANSNVILTSGGEVYLTKPSTTIVIEDYSDISDWSDTILRSDGSKVEKVDSYGQYDVDEVLKIKFYKSISSSDWSNYNRLEFDFNVAYTEHGPIYFQITNNGTANTPVQLVGENETTDGWVTKSINLLSMNRDDVEEIAFYTEIDANDLNKVFNFDVDSVKIINDIFYSETGSINFIFNAAQKATWNTIYWDATTLDDTNIQVQTRSADTLTALEFVTFTSPLTISGSEIISSDSKYLEIKINLNASSDRTQTPILDSFTLNYTTSSLSSEWVVDTQEQWEDNKESSANLTIDSGEITIESTAAIGAYQFIHSQGLAAGDENIEGIDSNRNRISSLIVGGANLPLSPFQAASGLSKAFYELKSVQRLESRGYMVADTGNDRVFELDENGNVIWGVLSNTVNSSADLEPLTSTYNSNNNELAISFNKNIDVDTFDLTKIYLLKGSNLVQLNPGSEQLSQENLNFITIILDSSNANIIEDSTGDMEITIAKDAVQDTNGNSLSLSYNLDVFEGNVYWRRINKPVHAYKSENEYIVSHISGSAYLESVIEFDSSATVKWSFSEPEFAIDTLGSTEKNSNGDYIIADSANQRVIKVDGDNSVITFTREFNYYPVRATELNSGNILVTISDAEGGSGSRVVEIDNNGNVIFEFGFGLLKDPTNAVKLDNGNYVITM